MPTTRRSSLLLSVFSLLSIAPLTHALELDFAGEFTFCTSTCDSFAALGAQVGGSDNNVGSTITGVIDLPLNSDNTFEFSQDDDIAFGFLISNSAADGQVPDIGPSETCAIPGQVCNAFTTNPLPLDSTVARVSGSGEIGENGLPIRGELIFTWDQPPLSSNGIELRIDLATGIGEATLFGGVLDFFRFSGAFGDADGDGVADSVDNCIEQPNTAQRDSNGDGYGNRCDSDLNNDCAVNAIDLGRFRSVFFTGDADADFNGDGSVNFVDLGIMRGLFFRPPGPSAQTDLCGSL